MMTSLRFAIVCSLFSALEAAAIVFPIISTVLPKNDSLIFVQVIWRHGDRSPAHVIKTDKFNQLESWPNGLNQISALGMEQQFLLGQKLSRHYVDEMHFLNRTYSSFEVYVRSTNIDRTLISATANMVGFYQSDDTNTSVADGSDEVSSVGSGKIILDKAYPTIEGWPKRYVPIPVHAIDVNSIHLPNLDETCPRRDALTELLKESPQFSGMVREYQPFFDQMTQWCGEEVDPFNLWKFQDVLKVYKLYNRTMQSWATDKLMDKMETVNSIINTYLLGVGVKPYGGVDLSVELRRTRSGPITWAMLENMQNKAKCLVESEKSKENKTARKMSKLCTHMSRLKYYAFSMHDMTLNALAAGLGINTDTFNCYSSASYATAVSMELWRRSNGEFYIKLLLMLPSSEKFEDITAEIPQCSSECELNELLERSELIRPSPSMKELCENIPFSSGCRHVIPLFSVISSLIIIIFLCF